MFSIFSMFSQHTPWSPIRDGRMEQLKQPWLFFVFFWAEKLSLVYDQFAFYVQSESQSIYLFVRFMSHLLNKLAHSKGNLTLLLTIFNPKDIFRYFVHFVYSFYKSGKRKNFYVLGEFIFWQSWVVWQGRGSNFQSIKRPCNKSTFRFLSFKVQNAPNNKFAFSDFIF